MMLKKKSAYDAIKKLKCEFDAYKEEFARKHDRDIRTIEHQINFLMEKHVQ